jgi:hypothetical protein
VKRDCGSSATSDCPAAVQMLDCRSNDLKSCERLDPEQVLFKEQFALAEVANEMHEKNSVQLIRIERAIMNVAPLKQTCRYTIKLKVRPINL